MTPHQDTILHTEPMTLDHLSAPDTSIGIISLGYVGLPLAVEFGKQCPISGYDINTDQF